MTVKKRLGKEYFYSPILSFLKRSTNLTNLKNKLGIKKQNLNYYLREMVKDELIIKNGGGGYEVVKNSKKVTKYGNRLVKDMSRGHAYVWRIELENKPESWKNRISILDKKKYNYKLVGALRTTPRIKVMGRKVWLCNNHIRIFDIKKRSYYGKDAKSSREKSAMEFFTIVKALENKLGFVIKPFKYSIQKEHYALIKNDLAIEHNKKGIIMRVEDEDGEWLLIDDSLGRGGEIETVGKKAYQTNIPMQKWWNDHKENNFKVTPTFILNTMNGIQQNQLMFDKNIESHLKVLDKLGKAIDELRNEIKTQKR